MSFPPLTLIGHPQTPLLRLTCYPSRETNGRTSSKTRRLGLSLCPVAHRNDYWWCTVALHWNSIDQMLEHVLCPETSLVFWRGLRPPAHWRTPQAVTPTAATAAATAAFQTLRRCLQCEGLDQSVPWRMCMVGLTNEASDPVESWFDLKETSEVRAKVCALHWYAHKRGQHSHYLTQNVAVSLTSHTWQLEGFQSPNAPNLSHTIGPPLQWEIPSLLVKSSANGGGLSMAR